MRKLIWVLIVGLACLPLGMVGCGQTLELKMEEPALGVKVFDTMGYYKIAVTVKGSKESVEFSNPKAFWEWLSEADIKRGSYSLIAIYDRETYLTKIIGPYSATLSIKKRGSEDELDKAKKHIDTILSEFRKIIEEQGFTLKR